MFVKLKKCILCLFLLCIAAPIAVLGQSTSKASASYANQFQLGINFSPDYCYRKLKTTDNSPETEEVFNSRNNIEYFKIGYSTGINGCLNINNFLGIETGLQYSNKGYQTFWSTANFGLPDPNGPIQSMFRYHFHYLDIPMKANFILGQKKIKFMSSIGITTNFLLKETQTHFLEYVNHTERKKQNTNFNYKKVNISPTISAGITLNLNNKINLRIEPTFRYGLLKIINAPVTGYLYNVGLNLGCYYGL